jgi:hypothetical protein
MIEYRSAAASTQPACHARRRAALAVIVTVLAAAPFGAVTAQGNSSPKSGITAKDKVAAATGEAQKWQKDALLVGVETSNALPSGRAVNWTYLFNSPSAKQQIGLMIEDNGKVNRFDSPSYTVYRNAIGDFADSDAVMAEAIKQGLKSHAWGMSMRLRNSERPEWRVIEKDTTIYFNGATGKFLRKEKD